MLVEAESCHCRKWPLSRVTNTKPGPDEVVRAVAVKTKVLTYTRPVAMLHVLEDDIEFPQGEGYVPHDYTGRD